MNTLSEASQRLAERLGLSYEPVGALFAAEKPADAVCFKSAGRGCVAPLVFLAAKGKTVAFDTEAIGYPCSAFYFGYSEWIFPGIERFLADGPMPGRECERFVQTAELAQSYVASLKSDALRQNALVFKPLRTFAEHETPEVVLLFADADRMSALVYLAHFRAPLAQDRVVTGFASACASFFTIPYRFAQAGRRSAFWGLHDIAARAAFPKELTSLAMPPDLYRELCDVADESFLTTGNWAKLRGRADKI